jgi:hypothetical protein
MDFEVTKRKWMLKPFRTQMDIHPYLQLVHRYQHTFGLIQSITPRLRDLKHQHKYWRWTEAMQTCDSARPAGHSANCVLRSAQFLSTGSVQPNLRHFGDHTPTLGDDRKECLLSRWSQDAFLTFLKGSTFAAHVAYS